jgi:hypothetical protein
MQVHVNYLAIVVAAAVAFVLSWIWYALLSNVWAKSRGHEKQKMKRDVVPFVIAAVAYLLMAWMLAGLIGHIGTMTVKGGALSALFVWIGFVLTTTAVSQAFHGMRPTMTAIDLGNWLIVLLAMGAVIGAFGLGS